MYFYVRRKVYEKKTPDVHILPHSDVTKLVKKRPQLTLSFAPAPRHINNAIGKRKIPSVAGSEEEQKSPINVHVPGSTLEVPKSFGRAYLPDAPTVACRFVPRQTGCCSGSDTIEWNNFKLRHVFVRFLQSGCYASSSPPQWPRCVGLNSFIKLLHCTDSAFGSAHHRYAVGKLRERGEDAEKAREFCDNFHPTSQLQQGMNSWKNTF